MRLAGATYLHMSLGDVPTSPAAPDCSSAPPLRVLTCLLRPVVFGANVHNRCCGYEGCEPKKEGWPHLTLNSSGWCHSRREAGCWTSPAGEHIAGAGPGAVGDIPFLRASSTTAQPAQSTVEVALLPRLLVT